MASKLSLTPAPTFKTKVSIPVPGGRSEPIELEYKHRQTRELDEWVKHFADQDDVVAISDCVVGWDLSDEFNAENIGRLCDSYPSAAYEITLSYIAEMRGLKRK